MKKFPSFIVEIKTTEQQTKLISCKTINELKKVMLEHHANRPQFERYTDIKVGYETEDLQGQYLTFYFDSCIGDKWNTRELKKFLKVLKFRESHTSKQIIDEYERATTYA